METSDGFERTEAVRRPILIVTPDNLGVRMAGPAIRAFEMAKALARQHEVRLVSTTSAKIESDLFAIDTASGDELRTHAEWADVIVFQGHVLAANRWLAEMGKVLVADIYDPMHLEVLEQLKAHPRDERDAVSVHNIRVLNEQIECADLLLCASEKQRDFWLGHLASLGRINPDTYDADPSLRSLLDIVPFGVQDEPAEQERSAIRGVFPGIGEDDKVIIWGGGIYNWFDPLTLVRAVGLLAEQRPDVRLFFLGVRHPNPDVPEMRMAYEARKLSDELGLTDRIVYFNEEWVSYDDRVNFLLDADLGVSTHFDHLETAFSFRTRILDYLWAGLPIVSTAGDTFADVIESNGLGEIVPPTDTAALAAALERQLYDPEVRDASRASVAVVREEYRWSRALAPLLRFCADPQRAADQSIDRPNRMRLATQQEFEDRVHGLEMRIRDLESSTSWRITRPLRTLSTRLKRP